MLWLVLLAICFIVGGSPPPGVNETHYLTKARHYWDPSFCPGDAFLDSSDPHLAFYWSVGWLAAVAPLSVAAWVIRLLSWALVAWGWLRLGEELFGRVAESSPPSQAAARGGAAGTVQVAGDDSHQSETHESLPRPLPVREGDSDATRSPTAAAAFATALSFALWPLLIEYCNFAGEWVIAGGVEGKSFAYGFVLCGLAAMLRGHWNRTWALFGAASAFHVLAGGWSVVAAACVWVRQPRDRRTPLAKMAPALAAGGALALIGLAPALWLERNVPPHTAAEAARIYVFDRLPHHLAPLNLPLRELARRLSRSGVLLIAFGALAAANRNPRQSLLNRFAGAAVAMALFGLAVNLALMHHQPVAARVLRYYWFRLGDVAVPWAVATGAAAVVVAWLPSRQAWRKAVAVVPLAWCAWSLLSLAGQRYRQPKPMAARRMTVDELTQWQDACGWIRANAPADAVFLIPKHAQSFKWYAQRADAGNWKDVPQDAISVVAWRERIGVLFPIVLTADGSSESYNAPAEQGADQLRELATAYGITHAIDRRETPLPLPIVYANETFAVYDLSNSADR